MRSRTRIALVVLTLGFAACGDDPSPRPNAATPTARPAAPAARPAPARPAAVAGVAWSRDRLLRRLRNRRIRVDGRTVRLDPATIACTGLGRPTRGRGDPTWRRFRCVQPTFPKGSVAGPDALFVVVPTGRRSLAVTQQRLSAY